MCRIPQLKGTIKALEGWGTRSVTFSNGSQKKDLYILFAISRSFAIVAKQVI